MELHIAIKKAFTQFGEEILKTDCFLNVLADYGAFEYKPAKNVIKTMFQMGYGDRLYQMTLMEHSEAVLKIKSLSYELIENQGLQKESVNYVLECLGYGLGMTQLEPAILDGVHNGVGRGNVSFIVQVKDLSFSMVFVKGGHSDVGATPEQGIYAAFDEKPSVGVSVNDFYLGETLVTQDLWMAVMGENPSHSQGRSLPVERVSWNECEEFIKRISALTQINFRLPSEAEWEFAARGGCRSKHFRYAGADDGSLMWNKDNSGGMSHPVKEKAPNELELYDMCGNVSEWCSDWYFNSYSCNSSLTDPSGPPIGTSKVYRGGSWNDKIINCRVSKRAFMNPDYKNKLVGLRLAASLL